MMNVCLKCGAPIPLQQGRGRRRKMCETCSPSRNRGKSARLPAPTIPGMGDAQGVTQSVIRELTEAGMLQSHSGQCAVLLARRIDAGEDSGAAVAQLVRQLRETMASALAMQVPDEVDPVDELRQRREQRGA